MLAATVTRSLAEALHVGWYSSSGSWPQNQSARPQLTASAATWAFGMVRHTIVSGLPAGWAAWDHSRNSGLRPKRTSVRLA
jgi:hypothetical protein